MTDYSKIDKKVETIIKKAHSYMQNLNFEYVKTEIWKAYIYARDAHEGQFRHSGQPYINHPVEATYILLDLKPDIFTIQTCLLHDVIEDTPKTREDIKKDFSEEVAFLCEGLAKLSKVRYKGEERDVGSLRKMFVAMAEDLRVVFVKISDRLHNMKTLKYHPSFEKRKKIALETVNIYAPIADRLGLHQFKNALDEECFKILNKDDYNKIKKEMHTLKKQRIAFMTNAQEKIDELLKGVLTNYEIDYRIKSIYSIYRKLKRKGLKNISELFDIFGVRIIVETEADCYRVLGIIHQKWTPLPKRFKDYIALPKPNGYKSLHTSIMGLFKDKIKQPIEIQIKTFEMKEYSDIGVAAHFEYKEKGSKIAKDIDWVKELKDLVENIGDNDFVGSLKVDVFKNRIYVFTPKGDFINLPARSTPIDFAYAVHSDLGDHISVARVNNIIYPLDKELHNGDVIEIIIDKNKKPNPFRISFVKTVKAKNRIKAFLRKEDRELHIERGKEIITKYMEKSGLPKLDKELSILKEIDGKSHNMEERINLLERVGNFAIPPAVLLRKFIQISSLEKNSEAKKVIKKSTKSVKKKKLIIGGEADISYKLCYCCRRKLTNDIVAHINKNGIITVHKRDCKILSSVNTDRLLPAYIDGEKEDVLVFEVKLIVKSEIGILREISNIMYEMKIDIETINTKKIGNSQAEIDMELKVFNYEYMILDRLIDRIKIRLGDKLIDYSIGKIKK